MKILALDTSSTSGSIALLDNGRLVSELTVGAVGTHSQWLLKAIDTLLSDAKTRINEVGLFAIDTGPGSFTGLRIGISSIKGLAWPLGKKVVGVSTLKALAMNLRDSMRIVCPVLDARKNEVYAALYEFRDGAATALLPDSALKPEALFDEIKKRGIEGSVIFLGGGLGTYMEAVKNNIKGALFAPEPLWHLRAVNIGLLASDDAGAAVEPSELAPVYLRKSEAEIKFGH